MHSCVCALWLPLAYLFIASARLSILDSRIVCVF